MRHAGAVAVHLDAFQQGHGGPAGAHPGKIPGHDLQDLVHLALGFFENLIFHGWGFSTNGAHFLAEHHSFHVSRFQEFEDDDGDILLHGHGDRGGVHDPQGLFQDLEIGEAGDHSALPGALTGSRS